MKQYTLTDTDFSHRGDYADYAAIVRHAADNLPGWVEELRQHGFNVTREAILHNLCAWGKDFKSGYRDDENGYHLFSPCGCNPFRLDVTELDDSQTWQSTYIC